MRGEKYGKFENRKFASALIVPCFLHLKEWCPKQGIKYESQEQISKNEAVREAIMKDVEKTNKTLASFETIKKVALMPREWSIEDGEMTPKLSLKRKVILASNSDLIEGLYN